METLTNGFCSDALKSATLPNSSATTGAIDNPYGLPDLPSHCQPPSSTSPIIVTTAKDEIKNDGLTSLREAINLANTTPGGDLIQFASSVATITLNSILPFIKGDLIIDGTNDSLTGGKVTVSGDTNLNGINDRKDVSLLSVKSGAVTLNNLVLANGRAQEGQKNSPGQDDELAGALFINNGSVTLIGVDFQNNQAIGNQHRDRRRDDGRDHDGHNGDHDWGHGGDHDGRYNRGGLAGAIFVKNGDLTLVNTTFERNKVLGGHGDHKAKDIFIACGAEVIAIGERPDADVFGGTIQVQDPHNLVQNGDFEAGNTGFYSQYPYQANTAQSYDILSDPSTWNGAWSSFHDHTSGSETGNMMVVDGNIDLSSLVVWQQTTPVIPHVNYNFSSWVASTYPASPAQLSFQINGIEVGSFTPSITPGQWEQFSTIWNVGSNTSATLTIVDQNLDFIGNDFVLDDIALKLAA